MDNFTIGTFRENINLLYHNLHIVQDTIPKKLAHLTDVTGKWLINTSGDILPDKDNTVSLGSLEKRLKSVYVSDGSLNIVKHNADEIVSFRFGITENNKLQIAEERYSNEQDFLSGDTSSNAGSVFSMPETSQLSILETNNTILINAVKTVSNTQADFTNVINATNESITATTSGTYISPIAEYSETNLIGKDNLRSVYYNSDTKEILSSDGSGHFTNLNVSGIIKGPAELIIDPSPINYITGKVRIKGDLIVEGTETIINSTLVKIDDSTVSIKGSTQGYSGIEIKDEENVLANFLYDGINDKWKTNDKDLDIGTGKITVDEVVSKSFGNLLFTKNIAPGVTEDIDLTDILTSDDDLQIGISSISLLDPTNQSGSVGVYLMSKIFNQYFYTVLLEKNTGQSNLNFASETGILSVTGNNSGTSVLLEVKILNINRTNTL